MNIFFVIILLKNVKNTYFEEIYKKKLGFYKIS